MNSKSPHFCVWVQNPILEEAVCHSMMVMAGMDCAPQYHCPISGSQNHGISEVGKNL